MRFHILRAGSLGLLAAATIGCASGGSSASSGSVAAQAASGALGPALLQWSGRFRSQMQHDPHITAPVRNEASGSVVITAPNQAQTRVQLRLRLPQITDGVRLYWAIVAGSCGSNALPLMTVSQFPQIAINSSEGSLDATLSVAMPTSGVYHVNVFNANTMGQDESEVMTCADLTLSRRSNDD